MKNTFMNYFSTILYFFVLGFSSVLFFSCASPKTNSEETKETGLILKTQDSVPSESRKSESQHDSFEQVDPEPEQDFELSLVDSVFIPSNGILTLLSVHPSQDLFLLMEGIMGEKLLLFDRKGKILAQHQKPKDAPDGYGGVCSGAIFSGESIFVQGMQGIYEFDLRLNFKRKYPKKFLGQTVISGGDNIAPAKIQGNEGLLVFTGLAKNDFPTNSPKHYEEFNSLEWLEFNKGELQPILPLLPSSYLAKANASFDYYVTHFKVRGNRLTYAYHLEPSIYEVNLFSFDLKPSRKALPIEGFILEKGYPFGSKNTPDERSPLAGSIQGVYQAGGLDMIVFKKGLTRDRFPVGIEDRYEFRKEVNRRNPEFWILQTKNGEFTPEKQLGTKYKIVRSDSKGRIWAIPNSDYLDSEPEGLLIFELKITQK